MPSYILCRAHGGLNDELVQFGHCLKYAKKYGREIILQMQTYKSTKLKDVFDFSNCEVKVHVDSDAETLLKSLAALKTEPSYDFVKPTRGIFDHSKEYPSDVLLIHEMSGGGNGFYALQQLQLAPKLLNMCKLDGLPDKYAAVHIRDTDYKTDYEVFMPKLRIFVNCKNHPIFLATDSETAKNLIEKEFPGVFLSMPIKRAKNGEHNLHSNGRDNSSILVEAATDLVMLAKSESLMLSVNSFGGTKGSSGFGRLALAAQRKKIFN